MCTLVIEGFLGDIKSKIFCVQSADRIFFKELMGIFRNMQRAIASQQAADLEQPADLYFGTFNGIEVRFSEASIGCRIIELIYRIILVSGVRI